MGEGGGREGREGGEKRGGSGCEFGVGWIRWGCTGGKGAAMPRIFFFGDMNANSKFFFVRAEDDMLEWTFILPYIPEIRGDIRGDGTAKEGSVFEGRRHGWL